MLEFRVQFPLFHPYFVNFKVICSPSSTVTAVTDLVSRTGNSSFWIINLKYSSKIHSFIEETAEFSISNQCNKTYQQ